MSTAAEGADAAGGTSEGGDRPLVAVLDYGIGNLRSAEKALQRVGADARLTSDPGLIADAAGVVLPGVGAFGRCVEALHHSGLAELARDTAMSGRPFLGICVGMQLLYERSEEAPAIAGLGVLPGTVRLLPPSVKRPQMQWNVLRRTDAPSQMLDGLDDPVWVYFVHSYAAVPGPDTVATCDYGTDVVAAVERQNLWATQFHPEKSAGMGLAILGRFVEQCARQHAGSS
ncbi:MAG: imidazole glycerol phosphate synthase subunit HisH [Acidimicrobiia bacterium]|nr:imidazole glycerol phosphate synthase subunit HisH [Acidimicrobiia bacterium]